MFDCPINDLLDEYKQIKLMTDMTEQTEAYMYISADYTRIYNYDGVFDFNYSNARSVPKCPLSFNFRSINHR